MLGPVNATRVVLPVMRAQRFGLVVTFSSTDGIPGQEITSANAASKFAVERWMESLAHEVAPFGVRTMLDGPGFFRTDLTTGRLGGARRRSGTQVATGRSSAQAPSAHDLVGDAMAADASPLCWFMHPEPPPRSASSARARERRVPPRVGPDRGQHVWPSRSAAWPVSSTAGSGSNPPAGPGVVPPVGSPVVVLLRVLPVVGRLSELEDASA
jgi:NAD(P)-dependent dehydrogenase (short-subunit alcohol dehydrogenase family)